MTFGLTLKGNLHGFLAESAEIYETVLKKLLQLKCLSGYQRVADWMAKARCESNKPTDTTCYKKELRRLQEQGNSTVSYITYEVEASISADTVGLNTSGNQDQVNSFLKKMSDVIECDPEK